MDAIPSPSQQADAAKAARDEGDKNPKPPDNTAEELAAARMRVKELEAKHAVAGGIKPPLTDQTGQKPNPGPIVHPPPIGTPPNPTPGTPPPTGKV